MLSIVATPIGDTNEISLRALQVLKEAELIICESTKEASKLLRQHEITGKKYEILDEHSKKEDLEALLKLCETMNVALVSDCGTPGFCDPGAALVGLCRQKQIQIKSILGASSLMGLLSLSGQRLDQFIFRGFLPAENESRRQEWLKLKKEKNAIILMDTPYRLKKMMTELKEHFTNRRCLLVTDLSQESEQQLEGQPAQIESKIKNEKAEFMLLIYPEK